FVIRDGFDGYPGAMPVVVVALAVGGAGHAAFAKRCHFNARKDKPVRVGHGHNFRKPRVEQRFGVLDARAPRSLQDPQRSRSAPGPRWQTTPRAWLHARESRHRPGVQGFRIVAALAQFYVNRVAEVAGAKRRVTLGGWTPCT